MDRLWLKLLLLLGVFLTCGVLYIVCVNRWQRSRPRRCRDSRCSSLMIVLGSGGHTAEMLMLLRHLRTDRYRFRRYIVSSGDSFSAAKAREFENQLSERAHTDDTPYGSFDVLLVPRARAIHQSLLTTPYSALKCLGACLRILSQRQPSLRRSPKDSSDCRSYFPDLIITNGPATATIMIFAAILWRLALPMSTQHAMRCIYVESWARVRTLSLSGQILNRLRACDRFLVQWPSLAESPAGIGKEGVEYRGSLVA